jgi:hypothetical protein
MRREMLRLVTDSHVPPAVAKAARKLAALEITPLRDWHGGLHLNESDPRLLALAWEERGTLVTYDVNSFPLTVKERLETGLSHAGMIYVSARYRQNDVGGLARGLVKLWREGKREDWTNRIRFLD